MPFAPEYLQCVLHQNFADAKAFFLGPLMSIHHAHLVMLSAQGIVSAEDAHTIRLALDSISQDEVRGAAFDAACEDLYYYVERCISARCGDALAGRLHTARSRNDIDMTMYRMRQRESILELMAATLRPAPRAAAAGGAPSRNHLRRPYPHAAGPTDYRRALHARSR